MKRFFLIVALFLASGCQKADQEPVFGFFEADYVDLAAQAGGRLTELAERGQILAAGEVAFRLDARPEVIELERARAEVDAAQARLAETRAAVKLAQRNLERLRSLTDESFVSRDKLDQAQTQLRQVRSRSRSLEAGLRSVRAGVARLEWMLAEKVQRTPVAARVEERFYENGEWVPPGRPVLRLLPKGALKARFFVPEPKLAELRIGMKVRLRFDGASGPVPARIRFIATEPEFTPPVIFSEDSRARFVYRVEADIGEDMQRGLHPGQPLEVSWP